MSHDSAEGDEMMISSLQLSSTGPFRNLWGHFLWTVVTRDIHVFEWLLKKAHDEPMCEASFIHMSPQDDLFCGLLPKNYPIVIKSDLSYEANTGVFMGTNAKDDFPGPYISHGTQGVVVSGKPGLPTIYDVRFGSIEGADLIILKDVPGTYLTGKLGYVNC
eukprot:gnl/MRDRNA2_/MRDRNA2_300631_c0_seq1.p1 gnl/MRDRNA2_/MRDRNA2_300631_c0~~gnl/MRDRNA2_/MRDRNA2_300631_c0_seq1.p1  ORF type:complete len:181 (+),score=24.41 gnl/MRDRNA2_/MRDRNA2_300631_c0_seq1:63-545(+)